VGVLCRGESLKYLPEIHSKFDKCFLVSFQQGSMKQFLPIMKKKKIVNIINKKLHLMSMQMYEDLNIKDIILIASPNPKESIKSKLKIIKRIYKLNFIFVHEELMKLQKQDPLSVTSGELALILSGALGIENVYVSGLDFCATKYFYKEKVPCKIWKNRVTGMVLSLYKICELFPETNFYIYTCYKEVEEKYDNLHVKVVI